MRAAPWRGNGGHRIAWARRAPGHARHLGVWRYAGGGATAMRAMSNPVKVAFSAFMRYSPAILSK